jgi:hypothetical protein
MLAFTVSICLYLFWTFLGLGVLSACRFGRHGVRNALLAPTAGAALTLLFVFWLNRTGLPVRVFGAWLGAALAVVGSVLWWRFRPRVAVKSLARFEIILLFAALLTLRPMLEYGFNWISYGNQDMTNYVLGAERLYYHGYWEAPDPAVYLAGTDPASGYWFMHIAEGERSGADLLLAWLHSLMPGRAMIELFMPLIGTFHLMLIAAVTGLVYRFASRRKAASLTMLLLAGSALTSLGTLYQLIAQVWGLSLLATCAAVSMRPLDRLPTRRLIPYAALGGLLITGLVISYPEILPFLAAPLAIFAIARIFYGNAKTIILYYGVALVVTITLLGKYLLFATGFFVIQAYSGLTVHRPDVLFPYFLIPSGLADLWGFGRINGPLHEPWAFVAILLGAGLTALALIAVFFGVKKLEPIALVAGVMSILTLRFFSPRTDFGLFKLVLYVTPFLLGAACIAYMRWSAWRPAWDRKSRIARLAPLVLAAAGGLYSQYVYVERSSGEVGRGGNGLVEVPGASAAGLIGKLAAFERAMPRDEPLISDTASPNLAKIEAGIFHGHALVFPSNPLMVSYSGRWPDQLVALFRRLHFDPFGPEVRGYADYLRAKEAEALRRESFVLPGGAAPDEFLSESAPLKPGEDALITGPLYSVLNRGSEPDGEGRNILSSSDHALHNHMLFVVSRLSKPGSWFIPSQVSLFGLEPDLAFPRSTMSALGRYVLFEILQPSNKGYLALSLTTTYMGDGNNRLPEMEALGADVDRIPWVGRGSAHVILPFEPRQIDGRAYFALDVLSPLVRFPYPRHGLMTLYGRDIPLDPRQISGFARQVSYLSPSEYAALVPPRCVCSFPRDLAQPGLRYSGIYEDGWVAEESYFELTQSGADSLRVSGSVPKLAGLKLGNQIHILRDGQTVLEKHLSPGNFDLVVPDASAPGVHEVRILFDSAVSLSAADRRPASARLTAVGFIPSETARRR